MKTIRFRFLGPPQISLQDQLLAFPTRKAVALLVYLVAEGGVHQRDKLAAFLWPESGQEAGRAALRNTLARLRHAFKEQTGQDFTGLVVNRDTLYFQGQPEYELDLQILLSAYNRLTRAEQEPANPPLADLLQQAASLYRGDFLESFFLEDAPEYEQWVSLQRESWHRRVVIVFERLAGLQFEQGEFNVALDTATRWAALDPLNETAYQQQIRLHLALGNREAALHTFELCRKMLEREFNSKPTQATQALLEQIKAGPISTPKPAPNPGTSGISNIEFPLSGRTAEHSRLAGHFYEASQGKPRLVTLLGEAGIGKTRLSQEFTRWARAQGADVLIGQAFESGGRLPYQPLVGALRNRLEKENAPDDLLADLWLTELSRLLPELRERYPDLAVPAGLGEAEARSQLFEAIARLFQALADRRPLVLLLDDLQWADSATLDLFQYLSRRLVEQSSPVLLIFNLRSEALATDPHLADWLTGLDREAKVDRLTLSPFSAAITEQLVLKLVAPGPAGSPTSPLPDSEPDFGEFVRGLYRETGGQPFFLLETIKALVERKILTTLSKEHGEITFKLEKQAWSEEMLHSRVVAPGVREVIRARLGRLGPAAFNLIAAGAVLDHAFSFEQLCQVAGLGENEGLEGLDQLLKHSLFKEGDPAQGSQWAMPSQPESPYFFNHDKIRDVAYTEAGDARRRIFHRRAFRLLQANGSAWANLAHHAQLAGLPGEALQLHLKAGDNALRLFAVRDAISHYRQALYLWQQLNSSSQDLAALSHDEVKHLYLQLGRAYELNNRSAEAGTAYRALLDYAIEQKQPRTECAALNHLATLAIQINFALQEAQSLLEKALVVAKQTNDPDGLAETEWNFGHLALFQLDHSGGVIHGARALSVSRQIGQPDLIARSLNILGYHEVASGGWEAAFEHGSEASALYAGLGNRALEADSLSVVAESQLKLGRLPQALLTIERHRTILEEISNDWGLVVNADIHSMILRDQGKYGEALARAVEGLALGRKIQQPLLITFTLVILGHIHRVLLNYEAALQAHTEALAIIQQHSSLLSNLIYLVADALCADYAFIGDWEQAYLYAQQADDLNNDGLFLYSALSRWHVIEALLQKGAVEQAIEIMQRFKRRIGSNRRYGFIYLRCQAVLAGWQGNQQEALSNLQEAGQLAEELELVGEQWLLELELAKVELACGQTAQAEKRFELAAGKASQVATNLSERQQKEFLHRFRERLLASQA